MFAGLLLTAAVAAVVQLNEALLEFAADNFLLAVPRPARARARRSRSGISRLSAIAALGLFFVYAASLGLTIGLIVARLHRQRPSPRRSCRRAAMFGGAAALRLRRRSARSRRSAASLFMALIGLIVAMVVNIFLASKRSAS